MTSFGPEPRREILKRRLVRDFGDNPVYQALVGLDAAISSSQRVTGHAAAFMPRPSVYYLNFGQPSQEYCQAACTT
jgi:hypothetical protein